MTNPQEQELEENEEIPHDEGSSEEKARRLGWVPLEQYKGRKQWVDAEEYLRQLEEDSPKLRHVISKLNKQIEATERTNRELLSHHERQIQQERQEAYDRAYADAEAKHTQAVAAGDVEGATKAVTTMKALDKQIANPAANPRLTPEEQTLVDQWARENDEWYRVDPEMTKFAKEYETGLFKKGIPLAERLRLTTEKIQRRYPQEFTQMNNTENFEDDDTPTPAPRQQQRAPAQRNNSSGVRRPAAKAEPGSYEALTPAAKSSCDAYCRAYSDKEKPKAKAAWLKFARNDSGLFL